MIATLKNYLKDNFGSKNGFLNSAKYGLLHKAGYLRELRDIDFTRVRKLVFVCSGNICRSPFGEFYARHLGIESESFGMDCRGGDPPDPRMIATAEKLGICVHDHHTRNIRDYQPSSEDLVIAMEPGHLDRLPPEVRAVAQVTLAPMWTKKTSIYLHDPFCASPVFFDICAATIKEAIDTIAERLDEKNLNR